MRRGGGLAQISGWGRPVCAAGNGGEQFCVFCHVCTATTHADTHFPASSGVSALGTKLGKTPSALVKQALTSALRHAGMRLEELDGFLSCPALADQRFMWAHHLASDCGVLPSPSRRGVQVVTIDNGGASPVSMLLQARALVESGQCRAVAVVAGDSISVRLCPSSVFVYAWTFNTTYPHSRWSPPSFCAAPTPQCTSPPWVVSAAGWTW